MQGVQGVGLKWDVVVIALLPEIETEITVSFNPTEATDESIAEQGPVDAESRTECFETQVFGKHGTFSPWMDCYCLG